MPPDSARPLAPTPALCGTRLDTHIVDSGIPPKTVLDVQRRLNNLLSPDGPPAVISAGQPTEPARHFTDLRLLTLLLTLCWPQARHLAASDQLAAAIDHHVDSYRHPDPDSTRTSALSHSRPLDPVAGAGLLTIADELLTRYDAEQLRKQLQEFFPRGTRQMGRTSWARHFRLEAGPTCSPGLRHAVAPLVWTFTRQTSHSSRRAPELQAWFDPEHIPARLPDDWFDRHLAHLNGFHPVRLRRIAAIRLTQMIIGGSLGDAAHFLGIGSTLHNGHRTCSNSSGAIKWARDRHDPLEFDAAVRAIAQELNYSALINYRRRRLALRDWIIPSPTWRNILAHSALPSSALRTAQTDHGRQFASVLIWTRVTQGEDVFAPQPLKAQQPPHIRNARSARRHPVAWRSLATANPTPAYIVLQATLNTYADRLATSIDTDGRLLGH